MIERPIYVDKIMAFVNTPFVKILTGVRRCGKSTILKMIIKRLKTEYDIPDERMEIIIAHVHCTNSISILRKLKSVKPRHGLCKI